MDFDALATSLGNQFKVIGQAPAPFIACVLISAFIIWRMMDWRYGGIIARLRDELEAIQRKSGALPAQKLTKNPATSLPPLIDSRSKPSPVPAPRERLFLSENITPQFLMGQSQGRTALQADRGNAMYIGKWMRIKGEVFNVAPRLGGKGAVVTFKMKPFEAPLSLIMMFEEDSERLEVLHNGDVITVEGEIDNIDRLGLSLSNCEIVSEEKPA